VQEKYREQIRAKISIARASDLSPNIMLHVPGEHNRQNAMCALLAGRALGIADEASKKALEAFRGVSGRLELVREVQGVKFYNDTTATTPEATLAALRSLAPNDGHRMSIILIMGGADKGLDMTKLTNEVPRFCKEVVLLSGTGTEKIKQALAGVPVAEFDDLKKALNYGISRAKMGDIILFSPAFASFGMFKNEYDRGEQFVKAVKELS